MLDSSLLNVDAKYYADEENAYDMRKQLKWKQQHHHVYTGDGERKWGGERGKRRRKVSFDLLSLKLDYDGIFREWTWSSLHSLESRSFLTFPCSLFLCPRSLSPPSWSIFSDVLSHTQRYYIYNACNSCLCHSSKW